MWKVEADSLWILVGLPDRYDNSHLYCEICSEAASPSESKKVNEIEVEKSLSFLYFLVI